MKRLAAALLLCAAACARPATDLPAAATVAPENALESYVALPDPAYDWKVTRTLRKGDTTVEVVDLTSQAWRSGSEMDRTVWKHWMTLTRPAEVTGDTAMLFLFGGTNLHPAPSEVDAGMVRFAEATGAPVGFLRQIPNGPLTFIECDNKPRYEDDLIAFSFRRFLDTGDPYRPVNLAMVKSAVRAMDTIQNMMSESARGGVTIRKFVLCGWSKRGWTTWLTGTVDPRVAAIIPVVFDSVNIRPSMRHHHASYGFYAPTLQDYEREGVAERVQTPEFDALLKIVDPWEYRDKLTLPKYVITAAGYEYFAIDSSRFYFGGLKGEKHLCIIPNGTHSLAGTHVWKSILAYFQSVRAGAKRPRFDWKIGPDGSIAVEAQDPPSEVLLWQATNPKARDFRGVSIGKCFRSTPLEDLGGGKYVAKVEKPEKGWTAFLVELTYDRGPGNPPFKFTTEVSVVPDTLPFAEPESPR